MVPYNDLDAVDRAFRDAPDEVAALILEPAGVVLPKPGFLEELKALVHRHGALLIFDEVVTGLRWAIGVRRPDTMSRPISQPLARRWGTECQSPPWSAVRTLCA